MYEIVKFKIIYFLGNLKKKWVFLNPSWPISWTNLCCFVDKK